MLGEFNKLNIKSQNIAEFKVSLRTIWDNLLYETIRRSDQSFHKRLAACVKAQDRHLNTRLCT